MLEDALFAPDDADTETQAVNLNHSEAGCAFETQVDETGEEKDVAVCALTEKLPMTQEGRSNHELGLPTQKIVVCNALTGQCDFVLVEGDHEQLDNTELEMVPIQDTNGEMENR